MPPLHTVPGNPPHDAPLLPFPGILRMTLLYYRSRESSREPTVAPATMPAPPSATPTETFLSDLKAAQPSGPASSQARDARCPRPAPSSCRRPASGGKCVPPCSWPAHTHLPQNPPLVRGGFPAANPAYTPTAPPRSGCHRPRAPSHAALHTPTEEPPPRAHLTHVPPHCRQPTASAGHTARQMHIPLSSL